MTAFVKLPLLIFFITGVCLCPHVIAQQAAAVQIFSLESKSQKELKTEFKKLADQGVDTIIIRMFKNPGDTPFLLLPEKTETGLYFKTSREPLVSNLLPHILSAAHHAGLRCFAWITTRKCPWLLREHPEWDSPKTEIATGQKLPSGQLDIFREDVRQRLSSIILQLANSGVDGILIQDDWVSRQSDDFFTSAWRSFSGKAFSTADLRKLFKRTSTHTAYLPRYYEWSRYKARKLAHILNGILREAKSKHPNVQIAVNIYYETVVSPENARNWLSQDLEELLPLPVDFWAVMAYQHQISKELHLSFNQIGQSLAAASEKLASGYLIPPEKVLWKIQVQDWTTKQMVSSKELASTLKYLTHQRCAVVPYRGLPWLSVFQNSRPPFKHP